MSMIGFRSMGLLDFIFGSSPGGQYSNKEHYLSEIEIRRLVSRVQVRSLSQSEESLVEEAIIKRRRGDGKIPLRQIDETLRKLEKQKKISEFDHQGLMRGFEQYFEKKFR